MDDLILVCVHDVWVLVGVERIGEMGSRGEVGSLVGLYRCFGLELYNVQFLFVHYLWFLVHMLSLIFINVGL